MVNNIHRHNSAPASRSDGETVEALVDMLRRNGLEASKIDALISKASYPAAIAPIPASNSNRFAKGRAAQSA